MSLYGEGVVSADTWKSDKLRQEFIASQASQSNYEIYWKQLRRIVSRGPVDSELILNMMDDLEGVSRGKQPANRNDECQCKVQGTARN